MMGNGMEVSMHDGQWRLACMMGNGMEVSMHDGQWHGG